MEKTLKEIVEMVYGETIPMNEILVVVKSDKDFTIMYKEYIDEELEVNFDKKVSVYKRYADKKMLVIAYK